MKNLLLKDIEFINDKQVATLRKNNIHTVEDLLLSYPTKYDDYTIVSITEADCNSNVTIAGVVQTKATVRNVKTKLSIMNFYCDVEGRRIRVSIFNRHFLKSKLHYGVYVRITGKFKENMKDFTASEIHFDEFSNSIDPVFNLKGITDKKVLEIKEKVFEEYGHKLVDILPKYIRDKYNLIDYYDAIKYINLPEYQDDILKAIERIKFEELFIYQMKIKYLLYMRKHHPLGVSINYDIEKVREFIDKLPFKLTVDQETTVNEILTDLKANYKMNRLLQGEVGSGKTVVAAISLYAVITAGYQGAIMVPTEVLARQHYSTFKELFRDTNINIEMLSSSINTKDKRNILEGLLSKDIDILVGTHALFQKDVEFEKLGLVITDEEHRFGVKQRVSIVGKGHLIDHLKMSATPIPRTLAISVLGESDISIIKTLPGKKRPPITKYLSYEGRDYVINHIKEEIKKGHQVYVIAPMIEDSDVMDIHNANEIYDYYSKEFQDICRVGLIHGKLKTTEKESIMEDFIDKKIGILVSTTVIEVGVNVVNATTIAIYDADRFGVAQLHQMRGRVRRSDEQAYCFLISKSTVNTAIDRLKLVEANDDGFVLAEEDLIVRGPGDFFGEKQTGNVIFKMADIVADKEIFELANEEADLLISDEKFEDREELKDIIEIVHENYMNKKEMLD
ncbi:MAG: ATP-dependent DNA helicase RecG [Bacilli bacterium]|nr:ATP-dependent DNA helicase RecG [Bacilli bacterium]